MARKIPPEPAGERSPVLGDCLWTAGASWLLPGAGYWLLGYRVRAVLLGVVILALFWVGEIAFAENLAVSREVHPYFFIGQLGNGLSTLLANALWGHPEHAITYGEIDVDLPAHINLGILCTMLSGLLNILLVLHCADPRTWEEVAHSRESGETEASP